MELDMVPVVLPKAAVPIVLPVPPGGVKVLPRWAEEDEVSRWRLRYRPHVKTDVGSEFEEGASWVELELRNFTRELPLSNLDFGLVHDFMVAIQTPEGWSDWSVPAQCEAPPPHPPGKLSALLPRVLDLSSVKVRWTPPLDTATVAPGLKIQHYKILVTWVPRQGEDPAACSREIILEDEIDSYVVTGLDSLTDYTFQIAAENAAGWGELSDPTVPVQTVPPVPITLSQPTLRRATHHSAVIQWQHPPFSEAPVLSFCFRHTSSADWSNDIVDIHDVPPTLSQYVIQGLKPGHVYIFQVRAVNKYGMGIWSDSSIPIRTMDGATPSAIEDLAASEIYKSFIRLKWQPVEENGYPITGYRLRYAHTEDMAEPVEAVPAVVRDKGCDTCDIRHLRKLTYYFQVAAINHLGMAEWSEPVLVDMSKAGAFSQARAKASTDSKAEGTKPAAGKSAEELREKGNALFREGNHSKAVRVYDEAIRADPKDARCWANRAAAQMAMLSEFGQGLSPAAMRTNPYFTNSMNDLTESLKLDSTYTK
ncbi:TTN, partial [Symbiodinium pilosum]